MTPPSYVVLLGSTGSGKSLVAGILAKLFDTLLIDESYVPPVLAHVCGARQDAQTNDFVSQGLRIHVDNIVTGGLAGSRAAGLVNLLAGRVGFASVWSWVSSGRRPIDLILLEHNFFSLCPEVFANIRPEAVLVFMVRDGRDCAHRWDLTYRPFATERVDTPTNENLIYRERQGVYVPWWVEEGAEETFVASCPYARTVWLWAEMNRRLARFLVNNPARNVKVIKYESLVTDPVKCLEPLLTDLGFKGRRGSTLHAMANLSANGIGIHRKRSSAELAEAMLLARAELEWFGYRD